MKNKLDEAIELLTQLRINLTDSDRPALEKDAYDIEMKICEAHDLLNNVVLADVTQWVAISDKLPEDSEWILLGHSEDKWTDRGEMIRTGKWYNGECEIYPTHWAKLPEPPCG